MSGPFSVMIRRYSMRGSMEELLARVERQFTRQLTEDGQVADAAVALVPPGILGYQAVQTGDHSLLTITVFESEQHLQRAQAAARSIRESLADFGVEELETIYGTVQINVVDQRLVSAGRAVDDGR
jgi:hypothetical protein